MSSFTIDPNLAALAAIALFASLIYFRKPSRNPPGPPGLPLIGNILDFPKKESWKGYLEWGRQYNSDILLMKVPGTRFYILNSIKVIQDLLVKRSNIYSNSYSQLRSIKTTWLIVFMNTDERWKLHRHLFRREFDSIETTPVNRSHALRASRRLLRRLLTTSDHEGELRLAAVDSILSVTYGITPTSFEHPFIKVTGKINAIFADVARGAYFIDRFPLMKYLPKWFPGLAFHDIADTAKEYAKEVVAGPYEEIKAQVNNGTAVSSVASRFISALQDGVKLSKEEEDATRNVLANAYLAGSDTSIGVLYNFVLAMAIHPEVQKKAQKELDNLNGDHRLPDFSDFEHLPYLAAVVNEVFRWHPVTPFAVYHVSTDDDTYKGYHIPKGSILVPNAYAVLRDENIFGPDTDSFNPERFMANTSGKRAPEFTDVDTAFGFGRRACPGRFIARDTIWILAASILSAYEISDAYDMEGKKLTPDSPLEYTNAMISFAPKFKVSFKRRIPENMIHDGILN
ncbi:hypothetical protein NLJ89_g3273 [Agrocybe chaxingu]|uniref:Cytochrome P450 n=1 Tax=Agrocybe chaxingu TaxID=84603 RepID=A0A9W8K574_9AGAR|nr:hypothetical protein NLJ89_g3273 [Agrocybe chaxingu]